LRTAEDAQAPIRIERSDRVLAETYRLVARLGNGSTSEVFEAEHLRLGCRVALKRLTAELAIDPRSVTRFRREARVLSGLHSDNVVRVFDYHEAADDRPFFVMECLQGRDLRQTLASDGALAAVRAVHIALDVCRGLAVLHQGGLVHRDIKPANLFLTRDSRGRELCKILDLGVARLINVQTQDRAVVGTLRYMAPEQLADSASVTAAADVYAMAAVLYHCVSGRPPHEAETVETLMFEILHRRPPSPRALDASISLELDELIMRGLQRSPADRPELLDFIAELENMLRPGGNASGNEASFLTLREEAESGQGRVGRRSVMPLGLAIAAVIVIGAASLTLRARGTERAHSPASEASRASHRAQSGFVADLPPPKPIESQPPSAPVGATASPLDTTSGRRLGRGPQRAAKRPASGTNVPAPSSPAVSLEEFDQRNPYGG